MESWITLFTAHGKAKVQLSHVLQTAEKLKKLIEEEFAGLVFLSAEDME